MKKFRMILILAILSVFTVNCPKEKKDDNMGLLLFLLSSGSNSSTTTSTAPTITSFTPSTGPVGTTVVIYGTNFSNTLANNTVKFNGVTATATSTSTTWINVTVPTGATTGKITVTVDSQTGTSSTDFTVTTITTSCTTSSSSPATVTAGTAVTGTIANGETCYYAFTPTTTDIYRLGLSSSTASSSSNLDLYVTYGDSSVTGNPATATITATSSRSSDADWVAFAQWSSSDEWIMLHNTANVKHIIAIHGKSCPTTTGCTFSFTATAKNSSSTPCTDTLFNTSFSLAVVVESGAIVSGFFNTNTSSSCIYRLSMKTTTTNSYSVTGLTKDLDLYLGAVGSSSSTAEFTSLQSGTTSEAINNKTSTAGSFRYIQVTPYSTTNCSTGSYCSFTLGVTSP